MVKALRENNEIKETVLEYIKGATLLSAEEANNLLTQEERKCDGFDICPNSIYWLRSPGDRRDYACYIDYDGDIGYCYDVPITDIGVRPVLIVDISSSNLGVGDRFGFGDYTFKIISNNLALCDAIVDACPFNKNRKDGNDYATSYVKSRVDKWLNKCIQETKGISQGIKPDSKLWDEMDLGF